ncbi:hypothetical protein [Streptomyces sp. NRRL WC-3742]|uniref:hypothetical protein n=1 Tax=Streptomyces sp. NRRL WC-3742 TaxID=1463934 RepID=UPI0004C8A950|nr:hypothetical protein [Streptomyces sp. NRRL WC-3742]
MSNPPPLLAEDRPEYERLLGEALRDSTVLTALRAPGALTAAELRVHALRDADRIAAAAAEEYERYTALRESLRNTPPPPAGTEPTAPALLSQLRSSGGGAGLFPVLTVLTPILAWTAAVALLLLGYLVRAADPSAALAGPLITAGWTALAAGVAAMAVGIIGLVLTALRDGSAATPVGTDRQQAAELARARREWRTALRERGLLPYLHSALPAVPGGPPHFSSPGFSSPSYSSPDFTGPDDPGLGKSGPTGYTPPAFTGPDEVG